jgi:phosphatidylglycerol:prolipoprotein diacylglycerol transferase
MYPVLFRVGAFEITSFGVLVACGALVGLWLFGREVRRSGLPETALDAAVFGLLGGFVGAKLLYAVEHRGEEAFVALLFSRSGASWFGGFVGGLGTGVLVLWWRRLPLLPALAAAAPALAAGHAIGRLGCFLVGDDYGRPTGLPWGVAFPEGLPPTLDRVHPTQLYEMFPLALLAWLLVGWRRRGVADRVVLGRYFLAAGLLRFLVEFVRVNRVVAFGLTTAQLFALGLVVAGVVLVGAGGRRRADAPPAG